MNVEPGFAASEGTKVLKLGCAGAALLGVWAVLWPVSGTFTLQLLALDRQRAVNNGPQS